MIPGLPQVGGAELLIILSIILLFFGAKQLPSMARDIARFVSEARSYKEEFESELLGSDEGVEEDRRRELANEDSKKEPSL